MATQREAAEAVAQRVIDQFRRSGVVPSELLRHIQASAWARGSTVTREQVERYARDWINGRLEAADRKRQTVRRVADGVDAAIETLATRGPTDDDGKPWAEAVAVVEQAWRDGTLTAAQQRQLDVINSRYAEAG